MKIKEYAPAKINLYLEVLNKRADGYHNIETIMHAIPLYDIIEIEEINADLVNLKSLNSDIPCDQTNLVYKAASLVKKTFNIDKGLDIVLTKKIPHGAGLGGGSSDAASVIKALVKLWDIKASNDKLVEISRQLGADVAFFLYGGTAFCQDIGEKVTPLEGVGIFEKILLVNPNINVMTKSIYSKLSFPLTNPIEINKMALISLRGSLTQQSVFPFYNRFEEIVFSQYPQIKRIKDIITACGLRSLMSGSGSSVFGISSDQSSIDQCVADLSEFNCSVWQL